MPTPTQHAEFLRHVCARALDGWPLSLRLQELAISMAVDAYEHGDREVPGSDHSGVCAAADVALDALWTELP
jgi:hypothetical protein